MTEQSSGPTWRAVDSTRVSFADGAISGISRVLSSGPLGLVTAETPFHPAARDQPGDTGTVEIGGRRMSVVDCVPGAVEIRTGRLLIGADIPDTVGTAGWHWVVVHVLAGDFIAVRGARVLLEVDRVRRRGLMAAHTAHHLSGLALNSCLASLWRQGMPPDCLGNPDFDRYASASTRVTTTGFVDSYRIRARPTAGDPDELEALANVLGQAITNRIRRWQSRRAPVRIGATGPYLADTRWWECNLPQGTARVACGGVLANDLALMPTVSVTASLSPDRTEMILTGVIGSRPPGSGFRSGPSRAGGHVHSGLRAIWH